MDQDNNLLKDEVKNTSEQPETIPETPVTETSETAQEDILRPALPEIDFKTLNSEEIITQTQKLIDQYPVNQIKDLIESIPEIFENQYKKEYEKALADFTADGSPAEDFVFPETVKERFFSIYKTFREKRVAAAKQTEAEREKNLQIKLQLIEDLKNLVQKEETMTKTFQEFKEIQERWRNTGAVPQAQLNNLLETYHLHVENFYNYIKINKELRDLDLKRNLDTKIQLCEEAEKLIENPDITSAFKQLQLLHAHWKETGPIPKEQKDALWERFKTASSQINDKYHRFFESLRKEQEENLKVKEEICEKTISLAEGTYTTLREWNEGTKKMADLQEEWKHSGTVPQKERNRIYKKYRTACDSFYNRKREFYKQQETEQSKNLELKIQLCEQAEALQDNTDWKNTTNKIIDLQKEWKKIGPAPKKYSNKVWLRFRQACDTYFNNKNAHFKTKDSEQEKNLELKKALLEEIKQLTLSDNNEDNIRKLKEFQTRWAEIGFVPIKEKDALQEEYHKAVDAHFDKMSLDEFDKNLEKYRAKITTFETGENKEYKIINEREKLVAKIRQLETDIHTWENNIGFIAKSNKSEGLIRELTSKIQKTKQRLTLLQEKLKAIDSII